MRILALVLQYGCIGFALFLCYQVSMALYSQDYVLMEVVADVGTILICIDLAVFLFVSKVSSSTQSLQEITQKLDKPNSKWVYYARKLGHFGILLIITSWIVPMINS